LDYQSLWITSGVGRYVGEWRAISLEYRYLFGLRRASGVTSASGVRSLWNIGISLDYVGRRALRRRVACDLSGISVSLFGLPSGVTSASDLIGLPVSPRITSGVTSVSGIRRRATYVGERSASANGEIAVSTIRNQSGFSQCVSEVLCSVSVSVKFYQCQWSAVVSQCISEVLYSV
jgi:hypothetical protein